MNKDSSLSKQSVASYFLSEISVVDMSKDNLERQQAKFEVIGKLAYHLLGRSFQRLFLDELVFKGWIKENVLIGVSQGLQSSIGEVTNERNKA